MKYSTLNITRRKIRKVRHETVLRNLPFSKNVVITSKMSDKNSCQSDNSGKSSAVSQTSAIAKISRFVRFS